MNAFRQFRLPDPVPMRISQQQLKLGLSMPATTCRRDFADTVRVIRVRVRADGFLEPGKPESPGIVCDLACENFILNKELSRVNRRAVDR
jgi:hypothetical protein